MALMLLKHSLRENGKFRDINLINAKVGGDLQLAGSAYRGTLNATGLRVDGELHLSSGVRGVPNWMGDAKLILRNASVDTIQADTASWHKSSDDPNLISTDITGFTYSQFGGMHSELGNTMANAPINWLVSWIEAQHDHGTHHDPQPYEQLAKVLDDAGLTDKAKAIRYAKFEHRLDIDRSSDVPADQKLTPGARLWLKAKGWLVGYGVYPFQVLYWFGGLVGVGFLLALLSREREVRRLAFWYSLENALPLVEMNERFKNAEHQRWGLASFFHFQKVAGFLLATILVGALTLLGGN